MSLGQSFLTLARKAGVIVLACTVRAAVAVSRFILVCVPQTKLMERFVPNFQDILTTNKGSRAE